MKSKKRLIQRKVLFMLSILLFLISLDLSAAFYKLKRNNDQTCTITGYIGNENELVIPSVIEGYQVIVIGEKAFENCESLRSITLPDGVTSIGPEAFLSCYSLKNVIIPNSVTSIGEAAFKHTGLTKLPETRNVTIIKDNTYANCRHLQDVTIPDGVTSIGKEAFLACESLRHVIIPDSVTSIGEAAFRQTGLSKIPEAKNVSEIKDKTYSHCKYLQNIVIPSNISFIGKQAISVAYNKVRNLEVD